VHALATDAAQHITTPVAAINLWKVCRFTMNFSPFPGKDTKRAMPRHQALLIYPGAAPMTVLAGVIPVDNFKVGSPEAGVKIGAKFAGDL
jgi:hypothetical protein